MLLLQFEKVNICQWNHNKRLKFFNTVNNKENDDKRENVKSIDSKKNMYQNSPNNKNKSQIYKNDPSKLHNATRFVCCIK